MSALPADDRTDPADPADPAGPLATVAEAPRAVLVDGQRAVVWTGPDGELVAARDLCPHRRAPLSDGRVVDGEIHCPYHGWAYDGTGRCTRLPAVGPDGRIPAKAQLEMLEVPAELIPAPAIDEQPQGELAASATVAAEDWIDGDTAGLAAFWHPIARLGEVRDAGAAGLEAELLGQAWTLTALGPDRWSARCGNAEAWGVQARFDHLWVAPLEPKAELPDAPEWYEDGWNHRRMNRAEGRMGVGLLLDNQLDAGHFPFVHENTFGTPAAAAVPAADTARDGTRVTSLLRVPIAATNDPLALAGERPLQQHRVMTYEYHAPLWLRLRLDYEDMGGSTLILFSFLPLGAGRARVDVDLLFKHPSGFTEAQLDERVAFEERVVGEDLRLQRLFEDLRWPLDPTAELHTKADRLSLTCRQVLRELLAEGPAEPAAG